MRDNWCCEMREDDVLRIGYHCLVKTGRSPCERDKKRTAVVLSKRDNFFGNTGHNVVVKMGRRALMNLGQPQCCGGQAGTHTL